MGKPRWSSKDVDLGDPELDEATVEHAPLSPSNEALLRALDAVPDELRGLQAEIYLTFCETDFPVDGADGAACALNQAVDLMADPANSTAEARRAIYLTAIVHGLQALLAVEGELAAASKRDDELDTETDSDRDA